MAKRVRSPSYPAIDLKEAIERTDMLYKHERSSQIPVDVVLGHWGYSKGSGAGLVQIAALKKFGLLSEEGSGDDRQVQITKLAKDILIPHSEEERSAAILKAATLPSIYKEILHRYSDGLPSDQTLRAYLVKEREFNDNAIREFIKIMKATFSFANVVPGDIIDDVEDDASGENGVEKSKVPTIASIFGQFGKVNPPKPDRLTLGITLPTDGNVVLEIPRTISEDGLALLKVWIDACWKKLEISDQKTT